MSNQIAVVRKITVYNTSAQNNQVIESSAMTWEQLQQELERSGIPYSGMRAVVGENQNELITGQSTLMEGDMTLFLMPRRVKSGNNLSHLVDPDGIHYNEVDWTDMLEHVDDYQFITHYDLAMALQLKAKHHIELASTHFGIAEQLIRNGATGALADDDDDDDDDEDSYDDDYNDDEDENYEETEEQRATPDKFDWGFQTVKTVDPETARLRDKAQEIERNMQ